MRRTTTSMQRDGRPASPAAAAGRSRGRAWCWKGSGRARLDEAAPLLASLRVHSGSGRRGLKTWAYSVGVVSSRRDKLHKRCQSPQPLGQAPEPRPDVGRRTGGDNASFACRRWRRTQPTPASREALRDLVGQSRRSVGFRERRAIWFRLSASAQCRFRQTATITGGAHAKG